MAVESPTTGVRERAAATGWVIRLLPISLFFVSLFPRLMAVGRYVTPDEPIWAYRSVLFREAILSGRWADTLVAGHPGVITTWLGSLGISVQLAVSPETRAAYDWLTTMAYLTPDNVEAYRQLAVFLNGGRTAIAIVNSLGIVGIVLIVQHLWGLRAAVLAGLFLALDPFLSGLAGLFHVDGLCATFATLSLLALSVWMRSAGAARRGGNSWSWLALSGAAAGLAVLSKSPALLLVPVSGLVMIGCLIRRRSTPHPLSLLGFMRIGLTWGLAFLATLLIIYPALWASPSAVLATAGGSANRHLDEALRPTYFLGRVAFVHGPLFYPVVLLWRLSPVFWPALIAGSVSMIRRARTGKGWSEFARPSAWLLAVWAVAFVLAITPAAKKFDRYVLPSVPALLILAALFWAKLAHSRPDKAKLILGLGIAVQSIYWLYFAAYPLSAYNPLVGGPWTAVKVLPVGWGESISAAGRYLAATQPDADQQRALAGVVPSLAPFFPGQTLVGELDDPATADYEIITLGGRQLDPVGAEARTAGLELIHTEHYGGLDQSWVYLRREPAAVSGPPELVERATFGDRFELTAFGQVVADDAVQLTAAWRRLMSLASEDRYTLRIVISDKEDNAWSVLESDFLDAVYFYPPDWTSDDSGNVRYRLDLPPGMPPGTYQIHLRLIDTRTGQSMPVRVGDGDFQGVIYNAGEFVVSLPETIVSASRMQVPIRSGSLWLDGSLQLLGHSAIPPEALAGSEIPLDFFWHAPAGSLPPGLQLVWELRGVDATDPRAVATGSLSRFDSALWRTGESIQEKYQIPLPPDLEPGRYELRFTPLFADGTPVGESLSLGELQINNIGREYELPEPVAVPIEASFSALTLHGMDSAELATRPGEAPEVTLYWENDADHGQVYSIFVHLLDESGNIVLQADHWPGGLPTDILDSGQIVTDRFSLPLPEDLPPGDYRVRIGVYSAESGQRLPVTATGALSAELIGPDYVMLPVVLRVVAP